MATRVKLRRHALDGLEEKTSRNSFEMAARVKPNRHLRNWIGKKSSAIQTKGDGEGKTEPASDGVERGELCGWVQGDAGKTGAPLDSGGREKLCGALKDAARVKPSGDREWNQEVELHGDLQGAARVKPNRF
jgi:hypothetical protein